MQTDFPFRTTDYLVDDSRGAADGNTLLDAASAMPSAALDTADRKALAELAAAIHRHAPQLSADQTEQAIRWLKRWKLRGSHDSREESLLQDTDASLALWQIQQSREQAPAQRAARRSATWLRIANGATGVLCTLSVVLLVDGAAWYRVGAAVLAAIASVAFGEQLLLKVTNRHVALSRAQLLAAVSQAATIDDLQRAGLFELASSEPLARRQERLSDALYRVR